MEFSVLRPEEIGEIEDGEFLRRSTQDDYIERINGMLAASNVFIPPNIKDRASYLNQEWERRMHRPTSRYTGEVRAVACVKRATGEAHRPLSFKRLARTTNEPTCKIIGAYYDLTDTLRLVRLAEDPFDYLEEGIRNLSLDAWHRYHEIPQHQVLVIARQIIFLLSSPELVKEYEIPVVCVNSKPQVIAACATLAVLNNIGVKGSVKATSRAFEVNNEGVQHWMENFQRWFMDVYPKYEKELGAIF